MPSLNTTKTELGWWARLRLIGLFGVVFCIGAAGLSLTLRAMSPAPYMIVLTPKLEIFEADAAGYDTVFIGTSRTLYHIVPDTIEQAAQAAGCAAPSVFNFGVHGLTGAEQDWLIEQVLSTAGPGLQRIILEDPLPEARSFGDATSNRSRFFHGPGQYKDGLNSIQSYPESVPKRVFRIGVFASGVAYDLSGVGRAASKAFPEAEEIEDEVASLQAEHGFEALDEILSESIQARHLEFLEDPQKFADALEKYGWADSPNLDARADYMIGKLRRLQGAGIDTALYVSPDPLELDRTPQVGKRVSARADDLIVLNYNRPDVHADLFERDIWEDFSHVSRRGAVRLSQKIGADLCASGLLAQGERDAVR